MSVSDYTYCPTCEAIVFVDTGRWHEPIECKSCHRFFYHEEVKIAAACMGGRTTPTDVSRMLRKVIEAYPPG